MKYLEFRFTNSLVKHDEKENLFTNIFFYILEFILNKIVPKSNPLQDRLVDKVEYWMIEFEIMSGDPIREIGLDINKMLL
jgi:hypothetical protein